MGFNEEGFHADEFALAEVLQRLAVGRLLTGTGADVGLGLEVDQHLGREGFGLAAGSDGAEIILDGVLKLAVGRRGRLTLDAATGIDGMLELNGGKGKRRLVGTLIGKRGLRAKRGAGKKQRDG